jgi:hypothetical protein
MTPAIAITAAIAAAVALLASLFERRAYGRADAVLLQARARAFRRKRNVLRASRFVVAAVGTAVVMRWATAMFPDVLDYGAVLGKIAGQTADRGVLAIGALPVALFVVLYRALRLPFRP